MEKQKDESMTRIEFDLLDELYFLVSFEELLRESAYSEEEIRDTLKRMIEKGWVHCYHASREEIITDVSNFSQEYRNYRYLASKEGLLAHNL
jgi:NH3-dependent NAD+ synthetase